MNEFKHLSLYERQRIEKYLNQGYSQRFIARKLGRSVSSISTEIRENSINGIYEARKAHHKAYVKRRQAKRQCLKVAMNPELKRFVTKNILDDQSPEGISGRLKQVETQLEYASTKAIYKFVKSPHGRLIEKHLYAKAVPKKSGPKQKKSVLIDGRLLIDERPKQVEKRLEFGHFEGDFIESGKDGHGSLLVLVERKSRYPFLQYLNQKDTVTVNQTIKKLLINVPIKSLTFDNDLSLQKHEELSELLDTLIFFCHPHCPHEKGTVENRNKAIRRYVKKRSDLSKFAISHFAMVEQKLRTRFMQCLNYRTPAEVWEKEVEKVAQKKPRRCGRMREIRSLVECSDWGVEVPQFVYLEW